MKFPIDNDTSSITSHCIVCNTKNSDASIVLSIDAMNWLTGRVSERQRADPTIMPTPARMPQIVQGEFRLRLLDVTKSASGRYLTVISKNDADLEFCSTVCLRAFFNTVVDTFEKS